MRLFLWAAIRKPSAIFGTVCKPLSTLTVCIYNSKLYACISLIIHWLLWWIMASWPFQDGGRINVSGVEVCTGFKLKPEPGQYPRSSDPTRAEQLNLEPEPDPKSFFPTTNSQLKKGCWISRLHATVSKKIHVKKQIHQGSATSQGKRKNTYQLWMFMNIRCIMVWMVVYDKMINLL